MLKGGGSVYCILNIGHIITCEQFVRTKSTNFNLFLGKLYSKVSIFKFSCSQFFRSCWITINEGWKSQLLRILNKMFSRYGVINFNRRWNSWQLRDEETVHFVFCFAFSWSLSYHGSLILTLYKPYPLDTLSFMYMYLALHIPYPSYTIPVIHVINPSYTYGYSALHIPYPSYMFFALHVP